MNVYFALNTQFKTKYFLKNNNFKEHFGGDTFFKATEMLPFRLTYIISQKNETSTIQAI